MTLRKFNWSYKGITPEGERFVVQYAHERKAVTHERAKALFGEMRLAVEKAGTV